MTTRQWQRFQVLLQAMETDEKQAAVSDDLLPDWVVQELDGDKEEREFLLAITREGI